MSNPNSSVKIQPQPAMSPATTTAAGAHILVYPFPTAGHIIPLLDLTDQFLTRGLTITVVITPNNLPLLNPLISRHKSSSLQILTLPAPDFPKTSESYRRLVGIMRNLRDLHHPEILNWFRSHNSPPVAILSDFFLGWTKYLASEIGVERIVFSPSGVFGYSVHLAIWRELPEKPEDPNDADYTVTFKTLPNSPRFPWYQVNHVYRNLNDGDPDLEFYKTNSLGNRTSWGIVFNSFAELERVYIEHAKKEMGENSVWAVGPVLPTEENVADLANRGGSSAVESADLMTWLDDREDDSVVYVCFGSRTVFTRKQMDVLASALEQSGVHFVWVVRYLMWKSDDDGVIPEGFEDRVAGRGFIVTGWAPQVAILRHRAVGAFVTHCGWNSTLEGISAGVVMLTWPQSADQFANAQLLVNELKVGIEVGESIKLVQVLKAAVDEGIPERSRVKELSVAAARAVNGGSSEKDLDAFVEAVNELPRGTN